MKKSPGRPSNRESIPAASSFKVCGLCFSKLYRGCSHSRESCLSKRQKMSNIDSLLNSPSKVTKQRVASRIIDDVGTSLATLSGKTKNTMTLKSPTQLSAVDLSHIQTDLSLSDRQMSKLSKDIRYATESRTVIEPGLKSKLSRATHEFDDLFAVEELDFLCLAKDEVSDRCSRSAVFCKDVDELIDRIVTKRNLSRDDLLIRIGIDGGGGFLKIGLSVFELDEQGPTSQSRRCLSSGLSCTFKDSGVKRCMIVALVPDVQENYNNVKLLWIKAGLNAMRHQFSIACDLKLCNMLLGLMPHGSKHPCSWCTEEKGRLGVIGAPRTMASLSDQFWKYFESGRDKRNAMKFNVIHPSIVHTSDSSTPIIESIPPPELHLLSGPTATLFSGLEKEWSSAELWLRKCNVVRKAMHGGSFTGNSARSLLRNVDLLEAMCPNNPSVLKFVRAFRCFNDVVTSCFGASLQPQFRRYISEFQAAYEQLPLNVTPKIHAIIFHVPEFCEHTRRGLGQYSEQCIESLHHSFADTWKNFKIFESHPQFSDRLLRSVCVYNSRHI